MTEIYKIVFIFPFFLIFIFVPFYVFDKINNKLKLEYLSLNLITNCNLLLVISLTNLKISDYQLLLIILYLLIFLYYIFKFNFNFLKIKNEFLIFFISFLILGFVIASELNLGWDAKYFYYIKSLFFYENLGLNELSKFENNKWHPHFGSYLWAFFWSIPFFNIEYFGRLFYLFIYCFSIYFITIRSNRNLIMNYFIFFLVLLITFEYERFSGLQEILLFSFLLISSKILYDLKNQNKLFSIISILLIINLMLWIKSEGIIYGCFLVLILILNKNTNSKDKILVFLIFVSLVFFKSLIFNFYGFEINSQPYNLDFIKQIGLGEIIFRLKNLIIYGSYYSIKNIFFIISFLIIVQLLFIKNKQIEIKNFVLYFILNILFIIFAYVLRDMEIIYSLKTTLERIIFTSSAFYIYLVILYINQKIRVD